MKKTLALLLAATLSIGLLAGCSLTDEGAPTVSASPDASPSASPADVDANAAVVTIDGETAVTWSEFKNTFDYYTYIYSTYMGSSITAKEVVNLMISDKLIARQAKISGFTDTLTEEQKTELQTLLDEQLESLNNEYRALAEEEAAEDVEARFKEMIAEDVTNYYGKEMTYDEYIALYKSNLTDQYISGIYKEHVLASVTVEDSAVQAWYDENLPTQQSEYTETPASYELAQVSFDYGSEGAVPALYVPEGYSRVMDILVMPTGTLADDYDEKLTKQDELKAEYGTLAFEDALSGKKENAARLAEILTEYNALKAETDAMFETYMAEAKTKIEQAYAELQGGASFAEVMKKYTENADFIDSAIHAEKGMLIGAESTSWSNAVLEAFQGLTVGAYSTVFVDDDGYHILYYVADETPGARSFADMSDSIKAVVLATAQETEWNTLMESWTAGDGIVIDQELLAKAGA